MLLAVMLGSLGGYRAARAIGADASLALAVAIPLGMALLSAWTYLLLRAGVSWHVWTWLTEGLLAAGLGASYWRRRNFRAPRETPHLPNFWHWPRSRQILACFVTSLALIRLVDLPGLLKSLPDGDWDAWALWNMTARALVLGQEGLALMQRAELANAHPDYPWNLPLTIARLWSLTIPGDSTVPEMISGLAWVAVSLGIGLWVRTFAGVTASLVAMGLWLVGDQAFLAARMQYADQQVAAAVLAAGGCLAKAAATGREEPDRAWRALGLGGVMALVAAWTKNEGAAFAMLWALAALALVWRRRLPFRPQRGWMVPTALLGALPAVALLLHKSWAPANDLTHGQSLSRMLECLTSPERWHAVTHAMAKAFWNLGPDGPLVLLIAGAGMGLTCSRASRRAGITVLGLAAGQLSINLLVYLLTPRDLTWHLATSVDRVVSQIWPLVLVGASSLLHLPSHADDLLPSQDGEASTSQLPARREAR
ncbi:MAG: hypothetical protein VKO21_09735 [Candidatus Sericytochromatia bacterium]|nr:hypothetical protein [Candidatus Sericytochromatia bacterium]